MTEEQLQASIREMESSIRKEKNEFTNLNKKTLDLAKRLKENRERLKLSTQLPHMVANVGEILEPEEEEEGHRDGS